MLVCVYVDAGGSGEAFQVVHGANNVRTRSGDDLEVTVDTNARKWRLGGELMEDWDEEVETVFGDSLSREKLKQWAMVLDSSNLDHLGRLADELHQFAYDEGRRDDSIP